MQIHFEERVADLEQLLQHHVAGSQAVALPESVLLGLGGVVRVVHLD